MFNPDNQVAVDYNAMPAAVFFSPEVASVGIMEQEVYKTGTHYVAATYDTPTPPTASPSWTSPVL